MKELVKIQISNNVKQPLEIARTLINKNHKWYYPMMIGYLENDQVGIDEPFFAITVVGHYFLKERRGFKYLLYAFRKFIATKMIQIGVHPCTVVITRNSKRTGVFITNIIFYNRFGKVLSRKQESFIE